MTIKRVILLQTAVAICIAANCALGQAGNSALSSSNAVAPRKITGIVSGPDGRPAAGLPVWLLGGALPGQTNTDAGGRFEIICPQSPESEQFGVVQCVVVRDAEHNLAAARDFDEDSGPLELKLAQGVVVVGNTLSEGKPVQSPDVNLTIWLRSGRRGFPIKGVGRKTATPGEFEVPAVPVGRKIGIAVSAKGYGSASIFDLTPASEPGRMTVPPMDLLPANLQLAGQVVDSGDKPVADVEVHLGSRSQPVVSVRTDQEGRFFFTNACEGAAFVSAHMTNASGGASIQGGDTNVTLRLNPLETQQIQVVVTDPKGEPISDAQWVILAGFGGSGLWSKAASNGTFRVKFFNQPGMKNRLLVRSMSRNMAATQELDEDATNITVKIEPALTLTGRVQDSSGKPIADAQMSAFLNLGPMSIGGGGTTYAVAELDEKLKPTDKEGRYTIKCYPMSMRGTVDASVPGYGRDQQSVVPDLDTNHMELAPLVLKKADRLVSGKVVEADEKPVSAASITISGMGQPNNLAITDANGHFQLKVCEGKFRLYASSQNGFGEAQTQAGETNVLITLRSQNVRSLSFRPSAPPRLQLRGKPLPDLAAFNLKPELVAAEKPILLCLFDASQRPSRHVISQLEQQAASLRQQNVILLGIQASAITDDVFEQWKKEVPVSFPVGRVTEKIADSAKWASKVSTFPYLILTGSTHSVIAEGFPMDDLDAQIKKISK